MARDHERASHLDVGLSTGRRWFFLHRPLWALLAGTAAFALPVGADLIPSFGRAIKQYSEGHDLAITLTEHVLAALTIGFVGYWWLFGHKRQSALRSYRQRLLDAPDRLVYWYRGERPTTDDPYADPDGVDSRADWQRRLEAVLKSGTGRPKSASDTTPLRRLICERVGSEIIHSRSPAVAIVKGRAGTGRTGFMVELVDYLAQRGLVPIPLLARHGGKFDLEEQAKARFFRNVGASTVSGDQQDAIWRFARQSRGIVVLVDGVDKELLEDLEESDERGAAGSIADLQRGQIHLVLATTLDRDLEVNVEHTLGLREVSTVLREDLDRLTYPEAYEYLDRNLPAPLRDTAHAALREPSEHGEAALVDPFFLEILVALTERDLVQAVVHRVANGEVKPMSDEWRHLILATLIAAIRNEQFEHVCQTSYSQLDTSRSVSRGAEALRATCEVAKRMDIARDLTLKNAVEVLGVDKTVLENARRLNLLRVGPKQVAFTSDELGAYLYALTHTERDLRGIVRKIAEQKVSSLRHQRFALTALTFWVLEHSGEPRSGTFAELLNHLAVAGDSRPRLVAAALRLANDCPEIVGLAARERLTRSITETVDTLAAKHEPKPDRDPNGQIRLIRALTNAKEYEYLWKLASSRNLHVAWPAVQALAGFDALPSLEDRFDTILSESERALKASADDADGEASLNREDDRLGSELASLAWLLPSLRRVNSRDDAFPERWERLTTLCLDPIVTPLRGEMALAQGLKLAALVKHNTDYRELCGLLRGERLSFWHARLVLVQALCAHIWHDPQVDPGESRDLLRELHEGEQHPLTQRAIGFAFRALSAKPVARTEDGDLSAPDRLRVYEYLWSRDHDAVTRVEQRKWEISRLAADVVLLSNMTYAMWARDPHMAIETARSRSLPPWIEYSSARISTLDGGPTSDGSDRGGRSSASDLDAADTPAAVIGTWARFSEAFCSEQARLVRLHGIPGWMAGRRYPRNPHAKQLTKYWEREAEVVARWTRGEPIPVSSHLNLRDTPQNGEADALALGPGGLTGVGAAVSTLASGELREFSARGG
jgi:hypothetical protein